MYGFRITPGTCILLVHVMLLCARPHYIMPCAQGFSTCFFMKHPCLLLFLSFCLHCSSYLCLCFVFVFFVSVSPHFAITASTLLGGSLLCPCPVCNGSSTNPPSGNCSFPPSFVSSEPLSNTPFCQNRLKDARFKTLQTF